MLTVILDDACVLSYASIPVGVPVHMQEPGLPLLGQPAAERNLWVRIDWNRYIQKYDGHKDLASCS